MFGEGLPVFLERDARVVEQEKGRFPEDGSSLQLKDSIPHHTPDVLDQKCVEGNQQPPDIASILGTPQGTFCGGVCGILFQQDRIL